MTLSFSTKINGKPNYFIEKIWKSLTKGVEVKVSEFLETFKALSEEQVEKIQEVTPKVHTIREDASNRWRAGMDIHMVINNRTKNRFQFAPVVRCVSVQEIEILSAMHLSPGDPNISFHDTIEIGGEDWHYALTVKVDGKLLKKNAVAVLALNDGFDNVWEFFKYFDKNFKGKLIHWTDMKY